MRRGKKSIHVEVVALTAFIAALTLYAVFFTIGGNVEAQTNIDAGGGTKCAGELKKCQDMPETTPAEKQAKDECLKKNKKDATQIKCGTGKCIAFCEQGICRGDGGGPGCPNASDGGAEKAMKDAMDKAKELADKAKGEGKGGEMPKMPEIPKKEPKPPEPPSDKQPGKCPAGQESEVDGNCKTKNEAANFGDTSSSTLAALLDAFKKAFNIGGGGDSTSGLSAEDALAKIAAQINTDPTILTDDKPAILKYAQTYYAANGEAPSVSVINIAKNKPTETLLAETEQMNENDLSLLDLAAQNQNPLVPSGGNFTPEETNIVNMVINWLTSWFN